MDTTKDISAAMNSALESIRKDYEELQDGEEMTKKIGLKFSKIVEAPPREEFELLIGKNFSNDEVLIALFRPQEEQYKYYPLILANTHNSPADHPLGKLRHLALSLMFLVHRRSWSFLKEFVIMGGLENLTFLFNDENLYIRGQAIELFLSITDAETFDWFAPAVTPNEKRIHQAMLDLTHCTGYLPSIIENRVGSYPGGSVKALQLLAFWLSWVRALYTKDQKLNLSKQLIEELRLWSSPESDSENKIDEEIQLAKTIYEDFGFSQFQRDKDPSVIDADITDIDTPPASSSSSSSTDSSEHVDIANTFNDSNDSNLIVSGYDGSKLSLTDTDTLPPAVSQDSRTEDDTNAGEAFIPANEFQGTKLGYVFKSGSSGIGYYRDSPQSETTLLPPTPPVESASPSLPVGPTTSTYHDIDEGSNTSSLASIQSIIERKTQGNVLFKEDKMQEALDTYRDALHALMELQGAPVQCTKEAQSAAVEEMQALMVNLHTNSATALWKLSEAHEQTAVESNANIDTSSEAGLEQWESLSYQLTLYLEDCEKECRSALAIDPCCCKILYRLASVMLKGSRVDEALLLLNKSLTSIASIASSGSSSGSRGDLDTNSIQLLRQIRAKCIAASIVSGHSMGMTVKATGGNDAGISDDSSGSGSTATTAKQHLEKWGVTAKTYTIMSSLLRRNQAGVQLPPLTESPANCPQPSAANSKSAEALIEDAMSSLSTSGDPSATKSSAAKSSITAAAVEKGKTKTKSKASAASSEEGSETKPAKSKKLKKVKVSPRSVKALAALNKLSVIHLKEISMEASIQSSAKGMVEEISSGGGLLDDAATNLLVVWADKLTLKTLLSCTLDEGMMVLLLDVANHFYSGGLVPNISEADVDVESSQSESASNALKKSQHLSEQVLSELVDCERFGMTLTLSLIDHGDLRSQTKSTILRIMEKYSSTGEDATPGNIRKLMSII